MPALVIYLMALCLLLGGGYSALNWLAAPAPAIIVKTAKQRTTAPSPQAYSELPNEQSTPGQVDLAAAPKRSWAEEDPPLFSSIDRHELAGTPQAATTQRRTRPNTREAGLDQRTRSITSAAATDKTELSSSKLDHGLGKATKTIQPSRTSNPSRFEKRQLTVMTLRTIRFSDGRQVTQLIPYRGGARTLAFGSDE